MSVDMIFSAVERFCCPFVCLTGGEPLIHEDVYRLMSTLLENDYHVTVETNGSIPLERIPVSEEILISMDMKTPSSGMSGRMVMENLEFLSPRDQLKMVIADRVDYMFARKTLRENEINCPVIFTPER